MAQPFFGVYTLSTTGLGLSNPLVQGDLINMLNVLKNLIPQEGVNTTPSSPDFNMIEPSAATLLRNEIAAMVVAVQAGT